VVETRGAVPRERGAKMLIGADWTQFSVGGGAAEARVILAARAMREDRDEVALDLSGGAGAQGVCGGSMRVALERWTDVARARAIAAELAAGRRVEALEPNVRLLIVGGGHCGAALSELARFLDFHLVVYDPRPELSAAATLAEALETPRRVYSVLLNRDYEADVAALRVLATRPPRFTGMMGSRRRIATVRAALPEHSGWIETIVAPVGIELDAQTPHEIAVSILAQLIEFRRRDAP
jgi:xanthine dehydrogenase accessory factor